MSAPLVRLLSSAQAAALAGVSTPTIRRWQAEGRLAAAGKTVGGRWRYREPDVRRAAGRGLDGGGMVQAVPPSEPQKKRRWRVVVRAPKPSGKDGLNYVLRLYPPEGRRFERSAGTRVREEAELLAAAEERKLNGEVSVSLLDVVKQHVEWRRKVSEGSEGTLERYLGAGRRVHQALAGREVSKVHLIDVQDQLRSGGDGGAPLAAVTANLYLGLVGRAWEWAREREIVRYPWPGPKRLKAQKTKLRPASPEEVHKLLAAALHYAEGRYYPFWCLLADLGCRISEVLHLRARDVDRTRGTVAYRVRVKNEQSVRVNVVSPDVLELLPTRESPDAWIFQAATGKGSRLSRKVAYVIFREMLRRAGLDGEPICPHSLRRSWVADSLAGGVPLATSMRHTGHASAKVHLDYQRLAPGRGEREALALVRAQRPALPHLEGSVSLAPAEDSPPAPTALSGGTATTLDVATTWASCLPTCRTPQLDSPVRGRNPPTRSAPAALVAAGGFSEVLARR